MIDPADITAADLIDPEIHRVAPFYGMDTAAGLLRELNLRPTGPLSKSLRFPSTYDTLILDEETGAKWETFDLGPDTQHWFYGQISINEDHVGEYFRSKEYDLAKEDLIPDMFISGDLFVSDKAKEIIEGFAPAFCYFAPAKFSARQTGKQPDRPIFQVYVRRTLNFTGPPQRPTIRPAGQRASLVGHNAWTSFCNSPHLQGVASELPIFMFNRNQSHPIFHADLFRVLKEARISGLLESTYYDTVAPEKSGKPIEFETVFPLDPTYR